MKGTSLPPPKIILVGPPAGGKGVQAELIRAELDVIHVCTGEILRRHICQETKVGLFVKPYVDRGELVPDEFISNIILERLQEEDCSKKGWLLEGFPRTMKQVDALGSADLKCDAFVVLELPDDVVMDRATRRRLDPETGVTYQMDTAPPDSADITNRLITRPDDGEECFWDRLTMFRASMTTVFKKFVDRLVVVDGNRSPVNVWVDVLEGIKNLILKSVVFAIGPPCCGKRSHCSAIETSFERRHLTLTDLINQEHYHDTDMSRSIENLTEQGRPISSEIIVHLVQKALYSYPERHFVVDAFPRHVQDVLEWNKTVHPRCVLEFVVFLSCPEEVILSRLTAQGGHSADGTTVSAVAKKYKIFQQKVLPVVEYYRRCGKIREVSAIPDISVVFDRIACLFETRKIVKPYERSVLLIKPDAVSAGHVPSILDKVKSELYLAILTTKFVVMSTTVVDTLFASDTQSPPSLIADHKSFLTSGPSLVVVVEGKDAISRLRVALGPEDPVLAVAHAPNSFRALYGTDIVCNACQSSINDSGAIEDINIWQNPIGAGGQCAVEGTTVDVEEDAPLETPTTTTATNQIATNATTVITDSIVSGSSGTIGIDSSELSRISPGTMVVEEDTLALIKPCSSELRYREITSMLAGQGFRIIAEAKVHLTPEHIDELYGDRVGKVAFVSFQKYMMSGPVVALHVRRDSAIVGLRHLVGYDDIALTRQIRPDSIRSIFATNVTMNAIEASETSLSAAKELVFYFPLTFKHPKRTVIEPPVYSAFGKDTPTYMERVKIHAKRRKRNQAPPPLSLSRHADMLKYLSDDVDVIFKSLIQRILIKRPKDVLGYAIQDLIEQQRLGLESSSRVKGSAVLKPITKSILSSSSPTNAAVTGESSGNKLSVSGSCNDLHPPSLGTISSTRSTSVLSSPADSHHAGKLGDFYQSQEHEDYDPTYNGKPLTASIAHAEILRLRDTIKNISENISAQKSQLQTSVDSTLAKQEDEQRLRVLEILHFGDWVGFDKGHDQLLEGDDLAKFIAEIKANATNNELILFSGNFLGVCKSSTNTHFSSMMNIMAVAGVNYGVLGNRDFEYGVQALENHIANSDVTWIMSNVVDSITRKPIANCESDVLISWNGIMIGIMGFADNWLADVSGITGKEFEFLDVFATATQAANDLRSRGAEVIIALTHCCRQRVDEKLSSIANIDLTLGGHARTMECWRLSDSKMGVRSPGGLSSITKMKLTLSADKPMCVQWPPGLLPVHADSTPDPMVAQLVMQLILIATSRSANGTIRSGEVRARGMNRKIGVTTVPLIGATHLIRTKETNLGNLIADIMKFSLGTSFAFINSGAIRLDGDMFAGFIAEGDIVRMLPYHDYVTSVRLTGKEIMDLLRNSVSRAPFPDGRFLQVSGITLDYVTEPLAPNDPSGSKCRFAKSGKKPIDPTSTYTCAMTGYLLEGNDGYGKCFSKKYAKEGKDRELCISLHHMVYEFFRSRSAEKRAGRTDNIVEEDLQLNDFEPIGPEIEHRMSVIVSKGGANGYYSRSSTMATDDDDEGIGLTASVNWDESVATGGGVSGDGSYLEDDEEAYEEEKTPSVFTPPEPTKFRKVF